MCVSSKDNIENRVLREPGPQKVGHVSLHLGDVILVSHLQKLKPMFLENL